MGAAVAIFYTATTSLFLIAFDRTMLPKAYIAGGLLIYGLGAITNYLHPRVQFSRLVYGLTYFLIFSVAVLLLCYELTDIKWFIFLLFIWNRVFVFVNGLTFWATASKIFNILQAKRLFGVIGTGEVVSSIVSFFSVPLLLRFFSTDHLLYIVAGAVGVCIFLISHILRRYSSKLAVVAEVEAAAAHADTHSWKDLLGNPYYVFVGLLSMMPVIGLFFVDFMFAVESKNVFPDNELLASFLGVFFGFCAIFEIVIKTVLYGRVISRFGLKLGITLLPLTLLFSITLAVSYGVVYGTTALFFAFIVMSRFFMSSVRKSVHEPSFQVLLQPIPAAERTSFLSRIEGGPKALGNLIPGVILLVLTSMSFIGTVQIAAFFLIFLMGWYFLSIKIQVKYRTALRELLKKSESSVREVQDTYYHIARRIAEFKKPASLNFEYSNFTFIIKLAESKRVQDRLLAAELLSESGRYRARHYLMRLIHDESCEVQKAALMAAGSMRSPELLPEVVGYLASPRTHEAAAYALLSMGEPIVRELGRSFVYEGGNAEIQVRLVRIIRQIGGAGAVKFLRSVINYPETRIRDEVYEGLKYLNYHVNISERSYVASELDDRISLYVWLMAAQHDLEEYPPHSCIRQALEQEKRRLLPRIFTLLSLLSTEQRYDFITELLWEDERTYGYLLEVLHMTLPDEWKDKMIPLFEDNPLEEKLKKAAEFFPQAQLDPEDRLKDVANNHFSRISCWLKVVALDELTRTGHDHSLVLGAHAVAPDEIIAETALRAMYHRHYPRFQELHSIMQAQKDDFHSGICQRIIDSSGEPESLILKVVALKKTDWFARLFEDDLIPLACELEKCSIPQGHGMPAELLGRYEKSLWVLASGELIVKGENGNILHLRAFDTFETSNNQPGLQLEAVSNVVLYGINAVGEVYLQIIGKEETALGRGTGETAMDKQKSKDNTLTAK